MTLPACLVDPLTGAVQRPNNYRVPQFYDVILSRPRSVAYVGNNLTLFWSRVPPTRCLLRRETLAERCEQGFLICVIREFDDVSQ